MFDEAVVGVVSDTVVARVSVSAGSVPAPTFVWDLGTN
jgi:hypothetical protein